MTVAKMKVTHGNRLFWDNHPTLGWHSSHHLIVLLTTLPAIAILLPYIVAISKRAMPAFLPLISQSGGHPPMCGMFAIPLIIMAFFGTITVILLHESINHRNVKHNKCLRITNKLSTLTAFTIFLGFILTVTFPIGYTDLPNKLEWIVTVLVEHTVGAAMIYAGAAIFHFFLTAIWCWLPDATTKMKYFRIFVSVLFVVVFVVGAKPMNNYMAEEMGPRGYDVEYMRTIKYELPLVFSTSYIICAFCQYAACSLAIASFAALYSEMKRISFRIVISRKSCSTQTGANTIAELETSMS